MSVVSAVSARIGAAEGFGAIGGLGGDATALGTAAVGVPTPDLGEVCGQLWRLRALAEGAAVAVTLQALERGVIAESACVDVAGWVRQQAWDAGVGLPPTLAAAVKTVTEQARTPRSTDHRRPDLRPLAAAVVAGGVPAATAKPLGRELDLLARRVPEPVWHTAATELIDWAAQGASTTELRQARQRIAAQYGPPSFEEEQAAAHRHREMTSWRADDAGGWECRLRTDNEGRAILDAAFDALAAPSAEVAAVIAARPAFTRSDLAHAVCLTAHLGDESLCGARTHDQTAAADAAQSAAWRREIHDALAAAGWITDPTTDTTSKSSKQAEPGERTGDEEDQQAILDLGRDTRTPGQRRHDALIEMARVVATDPTLMREVRPGSAVKAQVTITMDYDRLRAGLGPGIDGHGTPLTAATVRRMCCDAALIPAVLGAQGAILDWGRARRLASPDQIRYLRQRDKGCTFPGCTRPPAWTEAHHLDEWLTEAGPTNVDSLALLCTRHHDIVHGHHLKGDLIDGRIRWRRRSAAPAPAAAPPTSAPAADPRR